LSKYLWLINVYTSLLFFLPSVLAFPQTDPNRLDSANTLNKAMKQQKDPRLDNKIPWGIQNRELVSRISAEKFHFHINEPILIYYEVKNVSQEIQLFWHSGFWANHHIVVTNSKGGLIRLTAKGKTRFNAFSPRGSRRKNVPFQIEAGQIDSAWTPYDITQFYIMDSPGAYFIQYVYENYHGGWEGKLKSNILKVLIEE